MANFITGAIVSISETRNLVSRSGNAYKLRELVISIRKYDPNTGEPVTDKENTPQFVFMGDRCDELDKFQIGQMVNVYFDLQGRTYTDQSGISKIINELRPYKIELYQRQGQQSTSSSQTVVQPAQQQVQQPQSQSQPNMYQQPNNGYFPQQGYVCGDPF